MSGSSEHEDKLTHDIVASLQADCDAMDGETVSRLNCIRNRALAERPGSPLVRLLQSPVSLPLGAVAASTLVFALFIDRQAEAARAVDVSAEQIVAAVESQQADEVMVFLNDEEDLEFYENLELIEWLQYSGIEDDTGEVAHDGLG